MFPWYLRRKCQQLVGAAPRLLQEVSAPSQEIILLVTLKSRAAIVLAAWCQSEIEFDQILVATVGRSPKKTQSVVSLRMKQLFFVYLL